MIAVLMAATLLIFLLLFVVLQSKKSTDEMKNSLEVNKVAEVNQRLDKIFGAVHLCTCNLRDLVLAGVSPNQQIVIDPTSAGRKKFGFYDLDPTAQCVGSRPFNEYIQDANVSLYVSPTPNTLYPSGFWAEKVVIGQFKKIQDLPPYVRYSAKFTFVSRQNLDPNINPMSRSNQISPVNIDVYVEALNNRIEQCFVPTAPLLPPSSALPAPSSPNAPVPVPPTPPPPSSPAPGIGHWVGVGCCGSAGPSSGCSAFVGPCEPGALPSTMYINIVTQPTCSPIGKRISTVGVGPVFQGSTSECRP